MPKIYYCEHCHQFVYREGFLFEVDYPKEVKGVSSANQNKIQLSEVKHTITIGTTLAIIASIIIFPVTSYLAYSPNIPIGNVIILTLAFMGISVLIINGILVKVINSIKIPNELIGICPICKNQLQVFEVEHTNWVKIGTPLGVLVGILYFIVFSYLSYSPNIPITDVIINTLFFLGTSILIIIGIAGSLSIFDPNTAAEKVLKEHPELVENKRKDVEKRRKEGRCVRCARKLPPGASTCPYCGQSQEVVI